MECDEMPLEYREQLESVDDHEVDLTARTYRMADLPDPMGVNRQYKIWGYHD